jgi:arylsulfatase A-like enzyme
MKTRLLIMAAAAAFILIAGGLYVLTRPSPATSLSDCNVVVVVIDSLRADHLGCFGYGRATSPFLDSVAGQSVLFERANSVSSYTLEVVPALLSGLLPSSGGTATGWLSTPPPEDNLGEMFGRAGYKTGFFTDQPALAELAVDRGFAEVDHVETRWGISQVGPLLSARALEFVRQNKHRKFMMYLHYMDPHAPYDPNKESYLRFAGEVYPNPLNLYDQVRPVLPQLLAEGFGPGEARFDDLMLRYDAEIYEADSAIRLFFEGMKRHGVLDNTLVVLTADHGEEFLDHGYVEHAWRLYAESVHVPLFFYAPKFLNPARVSQPVSLIDVAPTVLDLAGVQHGRTDFDGAPLFKRDGAMPVFAPRTKPLIAELLMETRDNARMAIEGDYKYLAWQRWLAPVECAHQAAVQQEQLDRLRAGKLPRIDPWGPVVREELYNIKDDPGEKRPIQDEAQLARMRQVLEQYKAFCLAKPGKVRPQQRELTEEEKERKRKLGY